MNFIIRPAHIEDASGIFDVHRRSSDEVLINHYTREQAASWVPDDRTVAYYIAEIENPETIVLVAETAGVISGFATATKNYIGKFYTHPDYLKQGIGRALFETLEHTIKSAGHETISLNATLTSAPFYSKMGMQIIEPTTYRFNNGIVVDIYKMEKTIA